MPIYKLRIKELHFDAAHYLGKEFGVCHSLHGHTWKLEDIEVTTVDVILDFNQIKKVIENLLDHTLLVPEGDEEHWKKLGGNVPCKLNIRSIPGGPTVENISAYIQKIVEQLPGVLSCKFKLYEGANQGVEV